jgi:hypothetical protein
MSVSWSCPIEIPGGVAQGIQTILMGMDSWTLTEDNFEEFVARNQKSRIIMWSDDEAGTREPCTADQLRNLIGFRWS